MPAWFRAVRLRQWVHFLPVPLVTFDAHPPIAAGLWAAGRGVASAFAILAFGYLLNSVADRRMDLDASKNPFIVPGAGEYRWSIALLVATALVLALFAPWPAQLATLTALAVGYTYSTGPRFKSLPIIGSLSNVGNFAPLLFVGMRNASLPPRFGYVALAFTALLLQNQLIHEAADSVEDRGGDVRTTWLTLGPRWTAFLAALLGTTATVAAAFIVRSAGVAILVGVVCGAAFPLLLVRNGTDAERAMHLRLAHRWCAVFVGAGLFVAWRLGVN